MDISTFIKQSSNICKKVSHKYKCFVANGLTLPKLLLQSFQLFYTEMKINFLQTALVKLNLLASAISWWGDSGAEPSVLFSLLLNSRPWGIFIPCNMSLTFSPSPSCCYQIESYSRGPGSVLPNLPNPLTCYICHTSYYIWYMCDHTESPNRDINKGYQSREILFLDITFYWSAFSP